MLKKETVRLLRRIQKHVLKEPRRLVMRSWAKPSREVRCGTVGCIAGWAVMLTTPGVRKSVKSGMNNFNWSFLGKRALRIGDKRAHALFHSEYWPSDYYERLVETRSQEDYANVTVERIEHFIRTGE